MQTLLMAYGNLSISIFRRLSLFQTSTSSSDGLTVCLSISIFRRLSLFRGDENRHYRSKGGLSISIFRRLSLFHLSLDNSGGGTWKYFQSPFSGDFLCFEGKCCGLVQFVHLTFNLHFQETFFVSKLCFRQELTSKPFNLHFQETFFVSSLFVFLTHFFDFFQSPFSGDFLCFWHFQQKLWWVK